MTDAELATQAYRRFMEIRELDRGERPGSWCRGYIQGWLEHCAPDSSLALIRELRDAALPFNTADDSLMILAPVSNGEVKALAKAITRATQHLREHGADNPEAGGEGT